MSDPAADALRPLAPDADLLLPRLSPPRGRGVATYPPGATFGPRRMRDFEFVWIIEGDAEYGWGDATVAAPAGSVVLCRPGAVDFFRWDPARRTRHAFVHFDVTDVPPPPAWPAVGDWPLVRLPPGAGAAAAAGAVVDDGADILRPMFRHLLTLIGAERADDPTGGFGGADPPLVRLAMLHLLRAFVTGRTHAGAVAPDAPLPDAVEAATRHLMERLDADPAAAVELEELAEAACVTPAHLCRVFKRATGRSPVETVRLARLDRAAVLIARSNYGVAQIATMCGFASPFHFSRRFKSAFGRSPQQLRQAIADGETPPTPRLLRFAPRIG